MSSKTSAKAGRSKPDSNISPLLDEKGNFIRAKLNDIRGYLFINTETNETLLFPNESEEVQNLLKLVKTSLQNSAFGYAKPNVSESPTKPEPPTRKSILLPITKVSREPITKPRQELVTKSNNELVTCLLPITKTSEIPGTDLIVDLTNESPKKTYGIPRHQIQENNSLDGRDNNGMPRNCGENITSPMQVFVTYSNGVSITKSLRDNIVFADNEESMDYASSVVSLEDETSPTDVIVKTEETNIITESVNELSSPHSYGETYDQANAFSEYPVKTEDPFFSSIDSVIENPTQADVKEKATPPIHNLDSIKTEDICDYEESIDEPYTPDEDDQTEIHTELKKIEIWRDENLKKHDLKAIFTFLKILNGRQIQNLLNDDCVNETEVFERVGREILQNTIYSFGNRSPAEVCSEMFTKLRNSYLNMKDSKPINKPIFYNDLRDVFSKCPSKYMHDKVEKVNGNTKTYTKKISKDCTTCKAEIESSEKQFSPCVTCGSFKYKKKGKGVLPLIISFMEYESKARRKRHEEMMEMLRKQSEQRNEMIDLLRNLIPKPSTSREKD